jgi:predicted Holliday junction resolvase-like endonuclease
MKKTLLTLTLITYLGLPQLTLAATLEQVEQYLLVSRSEEELIALETQFSAMQNAFKRKDINQTQENNYDMQMLSLRFKEYIQKHLSEDEMEEILNNYKNVVLLQFISASSEAKDHDTNETQSYLNQLKTTPEANIRIDLVDKISKELYSKEAMMILFNDLMKPLIQNGIGGANIDKNMLKLMQDDYIKQMVETSKNETLFASKDFTIEELEELLKIAQTPAIDHESKAVFGAMAYALKEFFMSLSDKFDVKKHQASSKTDINNAK